MMKKNINILFFALLSFTACGQFGQGWSGTGSNSQQSVVPSIFFESYNEFDAYTGASTVAYITNEIQSGTWIIDNSVTPTVSNFGIVRTDASGKVWKRVFPQGILNLNWFREDINSNNINAALTAALETGLNIHIPSGEYVLTQEIELKEGQKIMGDGDGTIIRFGIPNISMFKILKKGSSVKDIQITSVSSSFSNNIGISIESSLSDYYLVSNVRIVGFAGTGIRIINTNFPTSIGGIVESCSFSSLTKGIQVGSRGEYTRLSGLNAYNCQIGIEIIGGNANVSNSNFSRNQVGIEIGNGTNSAHGVLTGVQSNHNVQNLKIESTIEMNYSNCLFYAGDILIENSSNQIFNGCNFSTGTFTVTNSSGRWSNGHFAGAAAGANTLSIDPNFEFWKNSSSDADGTVDPLVKRGIRYNELTGNYERWDGTNWIQQN